MKALYLHGFASGPQSSKAVFFAEKLGARGIETAVPDLNQPSFEEMTLSTQLDVVRKTLDSLPADEPKILIGSSMGGLLATMVSGQVKNLRLLLLLAPGFGLNKRWPELFGAQTLETWKNTGKLDVYHYAFNKTLPLGYAFFEDINNHDTENLSVHVPTIVFHGLDDQTVPIAESEAFTKHNSRHVTLYPLDDNHQLISSLEHMWKLSEPQLST
jgi:alpha-beta hydrolase superfamily lysophospholipase